MVTINGAAVRSCCCPVNTRLVAVAVAPALVCAHAVEADALNFHWTSKPPAVQVPQELGTCQLRVSWSSPGVTLTFRGTEGAVTCAVTGEAANRESAPSSSARAGRRRESWERRVGGLRGPRGLKFSRDAGGGELIVF